MTCKDCVHYELCFDFTHIKSLGDDYIEQHNKQEDVCYHFKNKADFVEVKRAKWIYATDCYLCSICAGKRFNLLLGTDAEYCPYCGAKMIFEKEGADNV